MKLKNRNCSECGKETEWYRGRPRLVCSKECEVIRRSARNKKDYLKKKPKPKPCKRCGRNIKRQGKKFKPAQKYCSLKCYKQGKFWEQKYKRGFDKQLRLIRMTLLIMRK
jgi:endogenous inhibitor of DNA gyrase (YacG/DUF329 family)